MRKLPYSDQTQAAEKLNKNRATVRKMIRLGQLPVVRIGSRKYIPDSAIEAWLQGRQG